MAGSDFPGAGQPPDGVVPDLENPKDQLHTVLWVTQGLTLAFVTAAVVLRVYAKNKILGNAANTWDDCQYSSDCFFFFHYSLVLFASVETVC